MKAFETSATVGGTREIHLAGIPFEPGTEVAVIISPRSTSAASKAAYDQLDEISQRCRAANWDGEEAEAVEQVTVQSGRQFLNALPPGYPAPDVTAEPDGH